MRKLALLLLICLPGLAGGQNFLSLFPDGLNDDNLEVFFGYWSLYSQNEASRTIYDFRTKTANTVFNTVFKKIYNEGKEKDFSECTKEEAEEIKNKYAGRYSLAGYGNGILYEITIGGTKIFRDGTGIRTSGLFPSHARQRRRPGSVSDA